MKRWGYLFLLPWLAAMTACGGGKGDVDKTPVLATMDSTDARGVQRMQVSEAETDIAFKGENYHSTVVRTPAEDLPHVDNGMGDVYMDNTITLRLTCGDKVILNRTFTKNDFAEMVDAEFLSKAVLEGMVYNKVIPQGILYSASVCCPQTDSYVPLSITVTADGRTDIVRVDMLEEVGEESE